jgi:dipeptidyl aminopeptidase/acylaminoacyl peptidase
LSNPSHAEKRRITAEDLYRIPLVGEPRLAPDEQSVAYVVTHLDKDEDTYRSAVWSVPVSGGSARQLTNGLSRDTTPRWSPDGSELAFVSNRSGRLDQGSAGTSNKDGRRTSADTGTAKASSKPTRQIWILPADGGEARQLTSLPAGASSPVWSPDGHAIAFLSPTKPEDDPDGTPAPETVADERVISSIRYRADGTGFLERYAHIWIIPASGGEPKQLTFGPFEDSYLCWTPDGTSLTFVSNRSEGHETNGRSLLYRVDANGGDITCLTDGDYEFVHPVWSPSGNSLALVGHDQPIAGSSKNANIWILDVKGSALANHSATWDRSFGDYGMSDVTATGDVGLAWSEDGQSVYGLASDSGTTHVYRVDHRTDAVEQITSGERRVIDFQLLSDGRVVILAGDVTHPFELGIVEPTGERALTAHSETFLSEVCLSEATEIRSQNPIDGHDVQGWVVNPPGFKPGSATKYPLILQIHGGPHSMYGHAFFHEMQLMAAQGHVVLFTNPRGSAGYGETFMSCTRGRWGESDMPDVMASVDTLVERGYIDTNRMGVTGGSYGGYLTNWIVGHSNRFRAAATQRCVSDFVSFYGTSDIGFTFGEYEFGGTPWTAHDTLRRYSPISYVENMETPLLILHSENDLRCPIEQAEQLFIALKKLGREVLFVRIPEEDHNLSRSGTPSRRLARLHHLLHWFDDHL